MGLKEKLGITTASRIDPLGTMNICTKCYGDPPNSFNFSVDQSDWTDWLTDIDPHSH